MNNIKVFEKNVKRYQQVLGIFQEAFAEKYELSRNISAIKCYFRSILLENIQCIADALEIET